MGSTSPCNMDFPKNKQDCHIFYSFSKSGHLTQNYGDIKRIYKKSHFLNLLKMQLFSLKGVTGNVRWLNWVCSIVDTFLKIHLRHIKLFYDVYLRSLSAKSTFKIMNLGRYVFRVGFLKLVNNDDKKCKQNSTVK